MHFIFWVVELNSSFIHLVGLSKFSGQAPHMIISDHPNTTCIYQ